MKFEKTLRVFTWLAVLTVDIIAAVISYSHIYDIALAHGQHGFSASLLPFSVDGLILSASLVLLLAARRGVTKIPKLPEFMLVLGILATLGANIAYGVPYGALGAIISAWPAIAFIGSTEVALGMVRRHRTPDTTTDTPGTAQVASVIVPDAQPVVLTPERQEEIIAEWKEQEEVPSIATIRSELRVGQPRAQRIQAELREPRTQNGQVVSEETERRLIEDGLVPARHGGGFQ